MFKYMTGDILQSDANCLVNTVNCEGYMGKGIAYQFKKRFPLNNKDYVHACRTKKLHIGTIHTFSEDNKIIVNFPTKNKWREKSQLSYIHIGMEKLVEFIKKESIKSVAIPPLGCGNGGLKWAEVKPVILSYLEPLNHYVNIQIYEPGVFKKSNSVKSPTKPTLSHIILMEIKLRLNNKKKIELQKSAYLFNLLIHEEFFKFTKYKHGPYSHAIDIVSRNIKESQDYYKLDTEQYLDYCKKQLISKSVEEKLKKYSPFIKQSTNFINSFNDSLEVELAATVCFLVVEHPMYIEDIIDSIHDWSTYKARTFSADDITNMVNKLSSMHILSQNLIGQYEIGI